MTPANRIAGVLAGSNGRTLLLALFALFGTVALKDSYFIDVFVSIGIIFILVIALDLVIGYMGQLSLGHNGFFAIGAYFSAILTLQWELSPWVALISAVAVNGILASLLSLIVFRTRHLYLAIMTLSFGIIVSSLIIALYSITQGTLGISGVEPLPFGLFSMNTGFNAAIVVWIVVILVFWLASNIVDSRVGRAMRSIHADETAAAAMSVDLVRYKVKLFILSAVLASIAGSLYTHYRGSITPGAVGTTLMVESLMMLFLGGAGTLWGGLLGTTLLKALPQVATVFQDYKILLYAVIFIVILMFLPRGLVGIVPVIAGGSGRLRRRLFPGSRKLEQPAVVSSGVRLSISHYGPPPKGNGKGPALEVIGLNRYFGGLLAVGDLSFTVPHGQIQSLIGPNGAGKSTVLNLISGFCRPNQGEIRVDDEPINGLEPHGIARLGVGRTFQVPKLFENMTLLENVMAGHHRRTGTELFGAAFSLPSARTEECAVRDDSFRWLSMVGLDRQASAYPALLSHGQKRWLELARALASRPKLLLLDEPTSGLNETEKQQFLEVLLTLKTNGMTTLLVEHDMNFVMSVSDRIVVMNYGRKLAEGLPKEVQENEEVVRAYLG